MSRQHQVLDVEIEGGISVIIFSLSFFFQVSVHWPRSVIGNDVGERLRHHDKGEA